MRVYLLHLGYFLITKWPPQRISAAFHQYDSLKMEIMANIFRRYQPVWDTLITLNSPEAPTKFKSNASCQVRGRIWPLLFWVNRLSNSQFQSVIHN